MERNERIRDYIIVAVLIALMAVSFFWIARVASSEENFTGIYQALDEKRTTVTELMGVTAAASTAITLIPGDVGTPIAQQLADLSGYFMFIMAALCLEKWMVTITGMLAFKILIPIGCLILIAAKLFKGDGLRELGCKIILVALMMFAIVPASVVLTEKIDASYQASIRQMIEDTRNDTEQIQNTIGNQKDESIIEKLLDKVKGGVSGTLDKFENTLNRITEAIAVLIVTSCAIPVGVLVFFLWMIKLITGVNVGVPRLKLSKMMSKKIGVD